MKNSPLMELWISMVALLCVPGLEDGLLVFYYLVSLLCYVISHNQHELGMHQITCYNNRLKKENLYNCQFGNLFCLVSIYFAFG